MQVVGDTWKRGCVRVRQQDQGDPHIVKKDSLASSKPIIRQTRDA
jgi:hypothetical protein